MARGPQLPDTPPAFHNSLVTIVVGLDGSDSAWNAYWWSWGEAKRLGGRIVAVFVSPSAGVTPATTRRVCSRCGHRCHVCARKRRFRCGTSQSLCCSKRGADRRRQVIQGPAPSRRFAGTAAHQELQCSGHRRGPLSFVPTWSASDRLRGRSGEPTPVLSDQGRNIREAIASLTHPCRRGT